MKKKEFQPTDIPGCRLWLDFTDPSTHTYKKGNVTHIADKSGAEKLMKIWIGILFGLGGLSVIMGTLLAATHWKTNACFLGLIVAGIGAIAINLGAGLISKKKK